MWSTQNPVLYTVQVNPITCVNTRLKQMTTEQRYVAGTRVSTL
jgi:hypothetical protein